MDLQKEIKFCQKQIKQTNAQAMSAKSFEIFKSLMFLSSCMELRIKTYEIQSKLS